ncbi:MAG: hypothetical protein SV186_01660 [Candidatus Nanohaloarchaea archaeon]|nr:hypothetical protein [Candidatus Nanohaloarchaea archaeon]
MTVDIVDTLVDGVKRSQSRNVGIMGAVFFIFGIINSIAVVSFTAKRFLSSSNLPQYVAGSVNTSIRFPLALTDSTIVIGILLALGVIGYIVSFVALVRIYLSEETDRFSTEVFHGIVRPAAQVLLGSIATLIILGIGIVLALYPTTMLMQNMVSGPMALIVFVLSLVIYSLFALYFTTSIMFFIPRIVDKGDSVIEAFKASFRLTGEDKFSFLLLIVGSVLVVTAVSIIGQLLAIPLQGISPYLEPVITNLTSVIGVLFQWGIIVEAYERVQ